MQMGRIWEGGSWLDCAMKKPRLPLGGRGVLCLVVIQKNQSLGPDFFFKEAGFLADANCSDELSFLTIGKFFSQTDSTFFMISIQRSRGMRIPIPAFMTSSRAGFPL